jgi:hypothetical protein
MGGLPGLCIIPFPLLRRFGGFSLHHICFNNFNIVPAQTEEIQYLDLFVVLRVYDFVGVDQIDT